MSIDNYPTPHRRGILILAVDFVIFLLLLKFLPFSPNENRGLALLVFVGILWLTEAFNITITALMVPVFAVLLGVSTTQQAFMLPIATPPNAMVFATGHIRQSEMAKIGFYMNIGAILIIGGLAYFFWI